MTIDTVGSIEIIAALTMLVGIRAILWHRIRTGKGTGARTVQLVVAVVTVPTILILALEGNLGSDATSALLGAIIGYVLSGVGQFQPRRAHANASEKSEPTP